MKIKQLLIKILAALFYFFVSNSFALTTNQKPVVDIQYWQTSQGVPVYFVHAPEIPMIDLQVIFTAGSVYDKDQWGLANITASMLNEGSQQHNADEVANAFDQVGAQYNATTNRDASIISLRSLSAPQYLDPALTMFTEVLTQVSFDPKSLARIKQQVLAAIDEQMQNPSKVAANAFYKNLYENEPYAHPILGTHQSVNEINADQVKNFYQTYFVAHNAKIILVGDVDRAAAEKITSDLMSKLSAGAPAPSLERVKQFPAGRIQDIEFPSQQTTIVTGQLGIDRKEPQYFPLIVGNYVLGQMPMNSLLFEQVRNQNGFAYDVYSTFSLMTYRGPFVIVLQTRSAEKTQSLDLTQKILQQFIYTGPSEQQLQLAKQNIINSFPLELSTNSQITQELEDIAINDRPLDFLDHYRENVNTVTIDQIRQAFQDHINPKNMLTVMVGKG